MEAPGLFGRVSAVEKSIRKAAHKSETAVARAKIVVKLQL